MNSTWGKLVFRSIGEISRVTLPNLIRQKGLSSSKRTFSYLNPSRIDIKNKYSDSNSSGSGYFTASIGGFSLGLLGFFEKKEDISPEDALLMEIKRAILAMRENELQKAERHLANSWKMSVELDREDVKTQIMDIQANLAFQKGELEKAIRLFQLVTQRLIYHQGFTVTDNAVVEISIKLAQMFSMKGKDEEALAGYQYCAETQIKKIENEGMVDEDTLMLAAWALQSISQIYMQSGTANESFNKEDISKASDYANKAYSYSTQAVGADSQQALAISTDIATLLAMNGKVDEALKRLEECEKLAADKHTSLHAPLRVNTGSLYLQKGDYAQAEKICKEAKMIAGMYRDTESAMKADECIAKSDMLIQLQKDKLKKQNETAKQNRTKNSTSSPI